MSRLNYKHWTAFGLFLLTASVAAIASIGDGSRFLILLVLAPLVTSMTTTPRRTAMVSAMTAGAVAAFGVTDFSAAETDFVLRAAVVLVVAAIAVQIAILHERDLRTRRRIALINSARSELEGSNGFEDELASLGRAAVVGFAEWVIIDLRIEGEPAERKTFTNESLVARHSFPVYADANATSTAYEVRASREGALVLHEDGAAELIDALFGVAGSPPRNASVIVVPVKADDFRATYFFVCSKAHPPWAHAEATQVESLARSAMLAARSDRLIDELTFARSELSSSRDQIEAIVNAIDDGVTAQSISGEMLFANERAAELFGLKSADELIGMHFGDVHPLMDLRDETGQPFDPMKLPSKRALAGERAPESLIRYTIKETGREWWTYVRARAVFGRDDTPTMAISVIEDVTERRREQLSNELLAGVGQRLHRSLDEASAVDAACEATLPTLGDWCAIDLVDQAGDLVVASRRAVDIELSELDDVLAKRDPETAAHRITTTTGRGQLLLDAAAAPGILGADETCSTSYTSAIVAPIVARGETLGAITVCRVETPLRHTDHDLETLAELGRRTGIAIDNSRVHADRTEMLGVLQRSLVPPVLPSIDGMSLTARYVAAERASEVGGDFYDVLRLADGSPTIVVGDICGKGTRAAALTSMARHTLRTAAMKEADVVDVVSTLNTALRDYDEPDQFSTLCAIQLGPRQNGACDLTIVNCGHPLPIIASADGARPVGRPGTLLGIVERPDMSATHAVLEKDQKLVIYTDGLSGGETMDDTAFAVETVELALANPGALTADRICDAAIARHEHERRDDIAVVTASLSGTN